jgi:hypothetical protein
MDGSLLVSVTKTPVGGAGAFNVTGNGAVPPGCNATADGKVIHVPEEPPDDPVAAFAAVTVTVEGELVPAPSRTINCATYVPATSATSAGETVPALDSAAELPAGRVASDHEYANAPWHAADLLPSNVTVAPTVTFCAEPAFATGLVQDVLTVTVAGALLTDPLFTINCATYEPARSATNTGCAVVELESDAWLNAGLLISDHCIVSGRPCGSAPLPFNITVLPTATV